MAGQALFMGRCEVKPSTDGWHILRAFWKLSSKVRPIAMTCNREHFHISYGELLPSYPLNNTGANLNHEDRHTERLQPLDLLPETAMLALSQAQLSEPWESHF